MSEEAVQAAEAAEESSAPVEEVKEAAIEAVAETEASVEIAETPVEAIAAPETPAVVEEAAAELEAMAAVAEAPAEPVTPEDVSYQAVEKEGTVTAIWEMQGRKHLRTIDPRSHEGKQILVLFETAG